jgi:hypothetical protein
MYLLVLVGSIVVQAQAWRQLTSRLKAGAITKPQGLLRYAAWAFLPLLCLVGGFAVMIGVEEWLSVALIEERAPLLVIPVFAVGTVGTIAFVVRCLSLRARPTTP